MRRSDRAAPERCEFRDHGRQCGRPRGHDPESRPHVVVERGGRVRAIREAAP